MSAQHHTETAPDHYEIRVDGVSVARQAKMEDALRVALDRKDQLPQQLVTLHDLRFQRGWIIDRFGRVITQNAGAIDFEGACRAAETQA